MREEYMPRSKIHIGDLVWIVLLLCLGADLAMACWIKSNGLRIQLLRATPAISVATLAAGAYLLAAGCILGYRSHEAFHRAINTNGSIDHLLKDGPYRNVRHPFYLSLMLISLALAVLLHSLLLLAGWGIVTFLLVLEGRQEEADLLERLGQEYADYQRETGMFLPRLARRN
jgi:protein-S-isoprenylcysteine O-methyltransferase Ste14